MLIHSYRVVVVVETRWFCKKCVTDKQQITESLFNFFNVSSHSISTQPSGACRRKHNQPITVLSFTQRYLCSCSSSLLLAQSNVLSVTVLSHSLSVKKHCITYKIRNQSSRDDLSISPFTIFICLVVRLQFFRTLSASLSETPLDKRRRHFGLKACRPPVSLCSLARRRLKCLLSAQQVSEVWMRFLLAPLTHKTLSQVFHCTAALMDPNNGGAGSNVCRKPGISQWWLSGANF